MKYDMKIGSVYGLDSITEVIKEKALYLEEIENTISDILYEYTSKNQNTIFVIQLAPRKDLER